MIYLGKTVRRFRDSLGLSQSEFAERIGVTNADLSNIENNESYPSLEFLDKVFKVFGVDLYVLAWCLDGDVSHLPQEVRESAEVITQAWRRHLSEVLKTMTHED